MLRDSKLRFDRLSPFVRFATIGAVLLCGLFVAGLRGPGVSAPVLADEPKQPAAAAGVEKAVEIAKNESNKSFVARLPSGITVELLGVSENPSKDKPWWRPDGTPLAERPYESLNSVTYSDQPHVAREFAVLVGNLPSEPVGTKLEFDPTYDAAGGGTPKLLDPYKGELHAMAVSLPDQPTVTVRFAVADGPWETVIENRGSTAMGTTKGGFIFSRPVETQLPNSDARVILISITHEIIDDETRVAAVGTDGQEHLASSSTGSGAHNFIQITAEFSKIALKDIKVFRLQKREYKWVEFRNVSLQAGQKTDVQIVLPDKDAHVETRRPTYTQSQNEPRGPVFIIEVDPRSDPSRIPVSDMNKLLNVIERRVNPDSKKIARIRIVEQSKFEVAMLDRNEAEADRVQRLLERSGRLEFRILANTRDNKSLIERALKEPDKNVIKDSEGKREAWWVPIWEDQENKVISKDIAVRERKVDKKKVTEVLVLQDKYNVTNDYLDHAGPGQDQSGRPAIEFSLNSQGGKLFGMLTGDNKPDQVTGFQRKLGIILDDHLFSAPGLRSQIFDRGVIEGSFTKQDVADLTDVLNSGSLPVWFRLVRKQSADTEADKEASKNNLKHLALAMHMYLDRYKRFPPAALYNPAGTTLSSNTTPHSWRVALLPLLGQEELYKQYHLDEPWDSPNNRKLLNKMPDVYRGPTDKFGSTNASYFALVGQGTMFDGKDGTRIQEVRDGTSNTILLVEAKRDIPWTKPEDIAYDSDKPLPELGGYFDYGFHTVFADGSVHFIPKTVSENVMRLLINKNDGQPVQLPPEAR
ncbi:MAG: DUF1559 domain-containing protein [Thermoguttaceae bacterium]